MTFSRSRAAAILVTGMVTGMLVTAAPAQAATCTSVPGSVTGTDVTILGDRYRVPSISNIQVCTDGASAPLVGVETSGNGYCSSACLSVLLQGDDTDAGAVTISYREDGSTRSHTVDPGGTGGGSDTCLLSVGSPEAPYPSCALALGPDELPDPNDFLPDDLPGVDDLPDPNDLPDANELLQPVRDMLPDVCGTLGGQYDPETGEYVGFCDDPAGWVRMAQESLGDFCEQEGCAGYEVICAVRPHLTICR
jgi:hypothetical protein